MKKARQPRCRNLSKGRVSYLSPSAACVVKGIANNSVKNPTTNSMVILLLPLYNPNTASCPDVGARGASLVSWKYLGVSVGVGVVVAVSPLLIAMPFRNTRE